MKITKEMYDSITFKDVEDYSVEPELIAFWLSRVEASGLPDEVVSRLILTLMKISLVSYVLGTRQRLN